MVSRFGVDECGVSCEEKIYHLRARGRVGNSRGKKRWARGNPSDLRKLGKDWSELAGNDRFQRIAFEQVITEIIQGVYMNGQSELESQIIGEMVMEKLIELDDVAYIRFGSVYRQFRDIHDFLEEVRPIFDQAFIACRQ